MRFTFSHSHAFPGCRVAIEEAGVAEGTGVIEFGDGVVLIGEWHPDGDAIRLSIPAHRTAKGTDIAAQDWRLTRGGDGLWRAQKIPDRPAGAEP